MSWSHLPVRSQLRTYAVRCTYMHKAHRLHADSLQCRQSTYHTRVHLPLQKRFLIAGAATSAGIVAAYRNDLTQLQFDTFSAFGPFLRLLDAESSHNVAIWTAKYGIVPRDRRPDSQSLGVSVWGRDFPNPIGMMTI